MPDSKFLEGGGEMGAITRAYNWADSALGEPKTWPQSLRTAVSIILNSKFPMFLWWGSELIQFYNDAYRPSLGNNGKHPAVGQRGVDCWPEIWPVIKPLIDQVLSGGEGTWSEDQLIPIYRNGELEDVYWTFSYSAVAGETGKPEGVFVTCAETTEKVKTLAGLKQGKEDLEFALDAADLGAWDLNPATNRFTGNERLKSWFGLPADAEIELPLAIEVIAEKDRANVMKAIQRAMDYSSGGLYDVEYTIVNPHDGKEILVRAKGKALFNEDHTPYRFSGTLQDITAERKASLALEKTEERFRLMADNISQLAWMADASGSLFWYNKRWFEYTGTTFEEMQGWGWQKVHHPDHLERVKQKYITHVASGAEWEDTFPIKSATGEYRWFLSRAVPVKDAEGKVTSWFGTNTDITERRKLEEQKDEFISVASHELKTPITSLKASLQLLKRMKDNPSPAMLPKLIEQADKSMDRVNKLVDDLLNVHRMSEGQLHLNKTTFLLLDAVSACCDHIVSDNKYELLVNGDATLAVYADERRIEQVVVNFVNNAVKYAPDSLQIMLTVEKKGNMAKVSVSDKGPGIPQEKIPHLFSRYYRADYTGNQYSGLGLGLYISAEIIKRHNGKIGVNSELGQGSTFWFTLPLK